MENEIIVTKLYEMFVEVCSYKLNKKTKVPTVSLKQEEVMELLGKISDLLGLYGKQVKIEHKEDGVELVLVNTEEV